MHCRCACCAATCLHDHAPFSLQEPPEIDSSQLVVPLLQGWGCKACQQDCGIRLCECIPTPPCVAVAEQQLKGCRLKFSTPCSLCAFPLISHRLACTCRTARWQCQRAVQTFRLAPMTGSCSTARCRRWCSSMLLMATRSSSSGKRHQQQRSSKHWCCKHIFLSNPMLPATLHAAMWLTLCAAKGPFECAPSCAAAIRVASRAP